MESLKALFLGIYSFINDFPNISDMSKLILFADDTSILLQILILTNLKKKSILIMSLLKQAVGLKVIYYN
jgi:hypothetical protein